MAKKYKGTTSEEIALHELSNFKHKDLQRACIVRGLDFLEVLKMSDPRLGNWFVKNYDNGQSPTLLNEYDAFIDEQLKKKAAEEGQEHNPLHPMLRLGYIGEVNAATGETTIKRPKGIKKEKKKKRERDKTTNLYTGTKKALTYELTRKNTPIAEIIKQVTTHFPEALEKSIKIWNKRCQKDMRNGCKA